MRSLFFIVLFVGAFSPRSHAQFTEVSATAGIDFAPSALFNLGGGIAWFDYDNDGWEDLYITGCTDSDRLYRNLGDGSFEDVSFAAGLPVTVLANTMGVTTGDIDNDGDRDVFLSTWRVAGSSNFAPNMLLRNNGDGTFSEVAEDIGLGEPTYGAGATFLDLNKDGWLDLYVACYIQNVQLAIDPETQEVIGFSHDCFQDNLYLNNGDGTFQNITETWDIVNNGCALAAVGSDKDGDGDTDILVANDFGEFLETNVIWQNEYPAMEVTEVASASQADLAIYAMGIAVGDYDEDHDLDYYFTNLGRNVLLQNDGSGEFTDFSTEAGVENAASNGLFHTGWGTAFWDYDNDGWLDLFVANGHLPTVSFIENNLLDPNKLYRNVGDGTFEDVSDLEAVSSTLMARGCAFADYDRDGDLDMAVVNLEQGAFVANNHVELFQNPGNENHYVQFQLQGNNSAVDAYGAWLTVYIEERQLLREVNGGSSHASQNSSRVHVGLEDAEMVDSVSVQWPSGLFETWYALPADTLHVLQEGTSIEISEPVSGAFYVFPNPAKDHFVVTGLPPNAEIIGLTDLRGRTLEGVELIRHGSDWELSWDRQIPTGFYTLRGQRGQQKFAYRIMIH